MMQRIAEALERIAQAQEELLEMQRGGYELAKKIQEDSRRVADRVAPGALCVVCGESPAQEGEKVCHDCNRTSNAL